jgi:hypothetical protein
MARFPVAYVGLPLTADFYNSGQQDWYWKTSATSITSDTSLNDDPDMSGIALDAGTYYVRARYLVQLGATSAAIDINVAWAFSGTATGGRMCLGMDTGVGVNGYWDGAAHQVTTGVRALTRMSGTGTFSTSINYGLRETFTQHILEDGILIVTAPGDFSVQWAQNASSATSLTMNAGSYLMIKQIA